METETAVKQSMTTILCPECDSAEFRIDNDRAYDKDESRILRPVICKRCGHKYYHIITVAQ